MKFGRVNLSRYSMPAAGCSARWLWLPAIPVLWELLRRIGRVNPLIMPPFAHIAAEFFSSLMSGNLASRWLFSMALVSAGLLLGSILALILILLSRAGSILSSFVSVLTAILHPLPGLALLPLVILVSGTGMPAVLLIIVHAVLWPMVVNLNGGFATQEPAWESYARNLGLSRWTAFRYIAAPAVSPYFVAGLRIGWARAWRSLIAAEMVFGAIAYSGGLGWQIFESRVMMDTPSLYAALAAVMITGVVIEEFVLTRTEKRILRRWGLSKI